MSRFHIRRRVKRALGRDAPEPEPSYQVALELPDGSVHEVRAEHRYTLVMASQTLETPIATGCPDGGCGTCRVEVLSGMSSLSTPTEAERDSFALGQERDMGPGERLACHARVEGGGVRVKVHKVWTLEEQLGVEESGSL